MKKKFPEPLTVNIFFVSLLVFVFSLQALILIVFIYQFIPLKMDPITQGVPASLLQFFKPNRNHLFYHYFVAMALLGEGGVLYFFRRQLASEAFIKNWLDFLWVEIFLVIWQLFAVFKILQYDNPGWARGLLYAGLGTAVLANLFWPEVQIFLSKSRLKLAQEIPWKYRYAVDGAIAFFVGLIILVPDVQKVLVRLALNDGNNHIDQWLMGPLWAFHQGLVPALESFNPLNWGVIFWIHHVLKLGGGLTYAHLVELLCAMAIIYYMAFYYFMRAWLGALIAIFGVVLAIKLQMFHLGVIPIIWAFPAQSILREFSDAFVFFLFWLYALHRQEKWLWMAAIAVGFSMSLVFDTGFYMLIGLYAYVAALLFFNESRIELVPQPKQWRKILGLAVVPWLTMLLCLFCYFGPEVLGKEFWVNSFQQLPAWLKGAEGISIYSCLKDRNFYAFFASFAPPLIYAMGVAAAIHKIRIRQWGQEKLMIVPLSAYGLGVYAHFLWHGSINYYYMAPLPLVGSLCFWLAQGLEKFNRYQQRIMGLVLIFIVIVGLLTNSIFTYYPGIFQLASENWDQEKQAYQSMYHFDDDAHLMMQVTGPQEPVALISNFATQILMQAQRTPFFYRGIPLMTMVDLQELLNELSKERPLKVFVDKRVLLSSQGPISSLVQYLKAHYTYSGRQSQNLVLFQTIK